MISENYFAGLYEVDVTEKVKKKKDLDYLPWSSAWAEVKKIHPDATYRTYLNEENRFWFDDGRSGWVRVGVTINGVEHIENFPIMDFKMQALAADKITSTEANKAVKRALTKACADHGLGLYLYEGEELKEDGSRKTPEEKALDKARAAVLKLCKEKAAAGANREAMYQIIKDVAGNKNPSAIQTAEKCSAIIEKINSL